MATQTSVLGLSKPAGNENALVSVLNSDMDLIDAEAGKVRGNIAATYSASSSYAVGDLCIYNGILYKCNTAISGGETWNASHWTQITIDGELTALNGNIVPVSVTPTMHAGMTLDYGGIHRVGKMVFIQARYNVTTSFSGTVLSGLPKLISGSDSNTNIIPVMTNKDVGNYLIDGNGNLKADNVSTGALLISCAYVCKG